MEGTKPGFKTSEFWITLLGTTIPTIVAAASGILDPKIAAIVLAVSSAAYGLIRALTKNGASVSGDASANVTVKSS